MRNIIKRILNEYHLLLEKRIGQISQDVSIRLMFEVNTTTHSFKRAISGRTDLEGYSERTISNSEIAELVRKAKNEIGEKIVNHEIVNEQDFVIKSMDWELSLAIKAIHVEKSYWKLIVKTVFRETHEHHLFTGEDEVVIFV